MNILINDNTGIEMANQERNENKEEINRNLIIETIGNKIRRLNPLRRDTAVSLSLPTIFDVYINISYSKIHDIDTINQRFQAEVIIESKWYDSSIKTDNFDEKKIWKPELYIENGIKDVREEVAYHLIQNDEKRNNVCEIRKVTGIFYENLELQDFPLDVQDLTITVTTKKPGDEVNFLVLQDAEKNIKISNTLDKSMWRMHNVMLTQNIIITREYTHCIMQYPAIKVSAKVFRLPRFFYYNAILPILLVTLASLAPFVVDIKIPQSRLPATCTLMLTSVSLRWTIGRLLPTVSYLTSLDKYSLCSMLIITIELLYHAIMGAIFPKLNSYSSFGTFELRKKEREFAMKNLN